MEYVSGVIKKETKEISELVKPELVGQTVKVNGAVHVIRDMGEIAFVILRKREGLLQCVYEAGKVNVPLSEIKEGTTLEVTGTVKEEEKAPHGIEIRMTDVTILGQPAEAMPLAISKWKMNASLDAKLNMRAISLRNIRERAKFKIQEGIVRGFREALQKESIGGGWVTFSGKYCTEYGIATTAVRMAHIVLHDEKAIMPASAELCGEYGESGLFAGVPCVLGANGVEQIVELPLTAEEQARVDGRTASVGTSIDAMGIPYYMSQMNQFLRSFATEFNNILKKELDEWQGATGDRIMSTASQVIWMNCKDELKKSVYHRSQNTF